MNSATITAILNIITALLPTIETAGQALLKDAQQLINDVGSAADATPAQLQQAQELSRQADAKQDAIYEALKAQQASDDEDAGGD